MGKFIDLSGQSFGRWFVIKYLGSSLWLCRCDCGTEKIINGASLRKGESKSCGCINKNPNNTETHRQCPSCKEIKTIEHFYKNKKRKFGVDDYCKECNKEYYNDNRNKRREYNIKYYEKTKYKVKLYNKEYRKNNKDIISNKNKIYYENNKDKTYFARVKRIYDLEKEEFYLILEHQNYNCPICKDPIQIDFGLRSFALDHSHDTGLIRGITHSLCNTNLIGHHTLETAKNLVTYLSQFEINQGENVKDSDTSESVCCSISESKSQERYFKGI